MIILNHNGIVKNKLQSTPRNSKQLLHKKHKLQNTVLCKCSPKLLFTNQYTVSLLRCSSAIISLSICGTTSFIALALASASPRRPGCNVLLMFGVLMCEAEEEPPAAKQRPELCSQMKRTSLTQKASQPLGARQQ